jgi:hypothetical protein
MSRKILLNDIQVLCEMIQDQSAIVRSYEGKIPQIEIDILLANIRRLYEDYLELSKINERYRIQSESAESEDVSAENQEEVVQHESPVFTETHKEPHQQEFPVKEKIQESFEKAPETSHKVVVQNKKTKDQSAMDLFAETDSLTLGDKFRDQKKSTHDVLTGQNKEKTLGETILHPIGDLRTGIGVNDRFLMMNELFRGAMGDFEQAMTELNNQADLSSALSLLKGMEEKFHWKTETDAYRRLQDILRRRFT